MSVGSTILQLDSEAETGLSFIPQPTSVASRIELPSESSLEDKLVSTDEVPASIASVTSPEELKEETIQAIVTKIADELESEHGFKDFREEYASFFLDFVKTTAQHINARIQRITTYTPTSSG